MARKDYEVGYRRPPKHTQFQKGQSGNPSGKPRKVPTDEAILFRELSAKVTITEGGRQRRITRYDAILKKQILDAMRGDPRAVKFVTQAYKDAMAVLAPVEEETMHFTLVLDDPYRDRNAGADDDPPG